MNKKGLTLVEMIAVLVILSVIALIVTPNIYQNIIDYRERMTEVQLSTIEGATRNWVSDNVDKVPTNGTSALMVKVSELQDGAYLDQKFRNPNGGYFDNSDAFGLVYSKLITDETGNYDDNYIYEYGAYLDMVDYEKKMAIKYIKDNGDVSGTVTTTQLQNNGYMYTSIKNISNANVTIPNKTISVIVSDDAEGNIKYEASTD